MGRHERSCTANPQRVCEMHKHCEEPQRPIEELIAALRKFENEDGADYTRGVVELRKLADGCPACMLAAIRQSKLQQVDPDAELGSFISIPFDFKKELKAFWDDVNDANYQGACC
jgi:hypothetical protein